MKYISVALCLVLFLTSCGGGPVKPNDSKIKESINTYLTTGVDKKDMLKIDSIGINAVDTLTQKNILKISLDRDYNTLKNLNAIYDSKVALIKADEALLVSLQQQQALYNKHKEKYDDASLKEQMGKMKTDSAEMNESMTNIQTTKNAIDSITKLYTNADSVSFYAYYAGANIYLNGGTTEQGTYIISKDWKVSR